MRRLFFARNDADFDFLEPGLFQPVMQIALGKTEPAVAVKFAGFVEVVLEQIENQNLSARLQNFVRSSDGVCRNFGVMQGLAQDHQVNAVRLNRRVLQIAEAEFQIFQSILFRLGRAERDDFFRVVHGDDFFRAARKQFAQQAFARAQIGDDERRQNPQQQMSERLPGAAWPINPVEASGDLVEINLRLLAAAGDDAFQIDLVVRLFRQFLRAADRELDEFAPARASTRAPR